MLNLLILIPRTVSSQVTDNLLARIIPALKQAEGLRSLNISDGHIMSTGGPPPYSKVIEASFDSLEVFYAWAKQNPSSQVDKEMMKDNGIILLYYDVNDLQIEELE